MIFKFHPQLQLQQESSTRILKLFMQTWRLVGSKGEDLEKNLCQDHTVEGNANGAEKDTQETSIETLGTAKATSESVDTTVVTTKTCELKASSTMETETSTK